jgi:hypothetical protein
MTLAALMKDNQAAVAERWHTAVLDTYPPQTAKLWKQNTNLFTNPVGNSTLAALTALVGDLVVWDDADRICTHLEDVIKIRAVQDFTPGKAVSFVFLLKKVIREVFAQDISRLDLASEVAALETRIDNLALMAFDIYVGCRERIYLMRIEEFKNRYHMVFRKAGITCTDPGDILGPLGPDGESA